MVSTIVSICPFDINEEKHGIYPGLFKIPASENNTPKMLVVGESIFYVEVDPERSIPVKVPSYKMAESIIFDFINSQIGIPPEEMATCGPGLFWKLGVYDLNRVVKECKEDLEVQKQRQHNWFVSLVKEADDAYEKTKLHRVVSPIQRKAAKILNLERPWLVDVKMDSVVKCPSCQQITKAETVVCSFCRCILDPVKYKTLEFASKGA